MSDETLAQLIALAAIALFVLALHFASRKSAVATQELTYNGTDGVERKLTAGSQVPPADASLIAAGSVKQVRRSALSAIVVGKDHRTSTSKTVAFAWTLAIGWGLLALLVAKWLGYATGWDEQIENGLQEEYLLLLGGPYAAAVLAKAAAVTQSVGTTSTPAVVGTAGPAQLVTDDEGDTDLGDFQYVLFNLIALTYFLGEFISQLENGFPDLPDLLTGLALVSASSYAAKKLFRQAPPTLTSVVPGTAAVGGEVLVYGQNLVIPASVAPAGVSLPPIVAVGGKPAVVTSHEQILGADRLKVTLAADATAGVGTISVIRADGIAAVGPAGSDGIPFTVG